MFYLVASARFYYFLLLPPPPLTPRCLKEKKIYLKDRVREVEPEERREVFYALVHSLDGCISWNQEHLLSLPLGCRGPGTVHCFPRLFKLGAGVEAQEPVWVWDSALRVWLKLPHHGIGTCFLLFASFSLVCSLPSYSGCIVKLLI